MFEILAVGAMAGLLAAAGGYERKKLVSARKALPVRIHVNGTRGKSSLVRLIAAGLRAGGLCVLGKTSGSLPALIFPDGSEQTIARPLSGPNIIEQARILGLAARLGVRALVMECMALRPEYQALCELDLIRSTHGVITNVGPDHLEIMGPTQEQAARALAATVPVGGKVFTAENTRLPIIAAAAADRGSELIRVTEEETASIREEDLTRFSYVEHRVNVAMALRLCREFSIDPAVALSGMWAASPDPGALTIHPARLPGGELVFVNAFGANDPDSSRRAWELALEKTGPVQNRILLINCRVDRPERSVMLGRSSPTWPLVDRQVVVGRGAKVYARAALRAGLKPESLTVLGDAPPAMVFEKVLNGQGAPNLVVGAGNIHEGGFELLQYLRSFSAGGRKTG